MFWGLVLEPRKRYTTTVEKSFHVSMAALDCTTVKQDQEIMSVMLETEGQESLLCNLCKQKGVLQEKLDLNFMTGDTVTFTCRGSGTVHLSGFLVGDDDDDLGEMGEEEEDEEDSGVESTINSKKKEVAQKRKNASVTLQQNKKKKVEAAEESDEEDEESSEGEEDAVEEEEGESDEEGESEEESDEEDEDEEDEEDEDEEDEDEEEDISTTSKFVSPQENKKLKQGGQLQQQQKNKSTNTPNKPQQQTPGGKGNKTPMANVSSNKTGFTPQKQQQSGKKDKKKGGGQESPGQGGQNKTPNQQQKTPNQQQKTPGGQKTPGQQANANTPKSPGGGNEGSPQKRTLDGGVVVKDLRIGNGPVAKAGKHVAVYYTGRLRSNNQVFDSANDGSGFKFRLGRGEVIKGWDVGVSGMKVGGKRLIICPPQAAYGQKGSPPHIPPNSSLVFEIELKAVN